jgi:hypothetical protein
VAQQRQIILESTKVTKWGKQAFRRKAEARKNFKEFNATKYNPMGDSSNQFRVFRGPIAVFKII